METQPALRTILVETVEFMMTAHSADAHVHARAHRDLRGLGLLLEGGLVKEELDGELGLGLVREVRKHDRALPAKPPVLRALQSACRRVQRLCMD